MKPGPAAKECTAGRALGSSVGHSGESCASCLSANAGPANLPVHPVDMKKYIVGIGG